jgi:hypothetical protein
VTSLAAVLAAGSGSASDVTPGVLGFIVVAAMGGVLFLLLRSMSKHLRRVRAVRDAGLAPGSKLDASADARPARTAGRPAPADTTGGPGAGRPVSPGDQ